MGTVTRKNILKNTNPTLAKEWHPTKNGILSPKNITCGSNKKVWWICNKGHEWEEKVNNRSNGRNCPYCSGHRVSNENNLSVINPILAKEWHVKNNSGLRPNMFTANSHKRVWWICKKRHEWEAAISSRNRGSGCPYCANQLANKDNCLQTVNPDLAKEWHPKKKLTFNTK